LVFKHNLTSVLHLGVHWCLSVISTSRGPLACRLHGVLAIARALSSPAFMVLAAAQFAGDVGLIGTFRDCAVYVRALELLCLHTPACTHARTHISASGAAWTAMRVRCRISARQLQCWCNGPSLDRRASGVVSGQSLCWRSWQRDHHRC
jgi:hypothetical protein